MSFLRITLAALVFGALLGCRPSEIPTGKDVPPLSGAVDYCRRNQGDENCPQHKIQDVEAPSKTGGGK